MGVATGKGSKKKKVNMSVRHLEEFEKESSIITLYKSADISNEYKLIDSEPHIRQLHAALH